VSGWLIPDQRLRFRAIRQLGSTRTLRSQSGNAALVDRSRADAWAIAGEDFPEIGQLRAGTVTGDQLAAINP
jgi:hypothetical protein